MKQKLLLVLSLCFLFYSCEFSKGAKKDLSTGLKVRYNGFAIDDIFLADRDRGRLNSNKVRLGTTLLIMATGVKNFAEKDGKVFPGCTIVLTDKNKKQLLNLPDAFEKLNEGTTAEEASTLQAQLNTGAPMVPGETYYLAVRFFDKLKKENEILANVDVVAEK